MYLITKNGSNRSAEDKRDTVVEGKTENKVKNDQKGKCYIFIRTEITRYRAVRNILKDEERICSM